MGKHRGRGPTGKWPAAPKGDALVVVNPSMLQSAARGRPKSQQNGKKKQQNQSKKRKTAKDDSEGPKRTQKKRKQTLEDKTIISNVSVSSAAKLTREEGGGASCTVLRVKKDVDVLAGLYWVLLSRNTPRPCVVALPNHDETSPAQLAAMLKHLGLQAVALHRKMTAGQRNETVQRLKASVSAASTVHAMVLVTTDQLLPTQDDEKWARKFAKGADLDDEDDGQKKKKKRAMPPDEQRLQALTEKLYVVLTRKLPGTEANSTNVATGGDQETDGQHRREKLEVLGLVTVNAAVGTALTDERTSAQTQWMDFAEGRAHGGQWEGAVRHGASKDATSLVVRKKLCAARGNAKNTSFLSKWAPNKEPVDTEKWGGAFGKVCGHNEVVMNELRAFYPQEVLNSKVCSKLFPAPGNQGFDGCLEHLRYACMTQSTSMSLWDAEYFVFISSSGRVTWSKKNQLLSLSLASLQCLVPALRSWTAACGGHMPPRAVLRAIQLCCQLGSGDRRPTDGKLPPKALKRIMSFAFGGSARLWRQIAKLSTLEEETVYNSQ
ncbi:hypothetical protein JG688_00005287 [Phytophthora aleatoria]|uniref:Uncharacterized protein n=1 Tax=Phytophthora aleatoria TaxID=2496075 RepID=A0A8J5IPX7_9STRA|nr:hypothetical protein JG688_00005287 [Phytophthora aleatoria]